MIIYLKKFGTALISRQTGREAFAALQSRLQDLADKENIEIDFEGVITFSPSWADEFLTPLLQTYGQRINMLHLGNPSVQATLELLNKIH